MKRISTIGLSVALAACNGHASTTAAPPDAEPEAAASAAVVEVPDASPSADASASAGPAAPSVHRRGFVGMFFKAAADTDLSDDQKTAIAKLEESLQADPASHKEMSALHGDLVGSLKEGKMDTAKIATDEAAVAKVLAAREEEQAAALAGLHDILTPAQRGAVADAVRAMRNRPAPAPPPGAPDWATRRLDRMKSQLVLDQDQQKEVAAVLARSVPSPAAIQAHADSIKKQTEAVASAFESNAFDAKKVDVSPAPGKKVTDPFDREIKYVSQLLPILTPGQRDRFASLMEHPRDRQGRSESITEAPDPSMMTPGRGP